AYLAWGEARWHNAAGRVGFVTGSGAIGSMQTMLVEALVEQTEAAGLMPVIFWFDGRGAEGLTKILRPARLDALVSLTHMMNGEARSAEFLDLDIPVIQTVGFREGGVKEWAAATSAIPARTTAVFLAVPESWGMIDPMVLTAVEDGAEIPLPQQVGALVGKLRGFVALRQKPAVDKHLAMLFWNYPAGEKN